MPKKTSHPSVETSRQLRLLPDWMIIRSNPESDGWRVQNAVFGLPLEDAADTADDLEDSLHLGSLNPWDVRGVYQVQFADTIGNDVVEASGFAKVLDIDGVPITIRLVDTAEDFFRATPTRWSHSPGSVETITAADKDFDVSGIIGLTYLVGHPLLPSGGYLVNWNVRASDPSGSILYDHDWIPVSGFAYGLERQSFDETGSDEELHVGPYNTSGELTHDPLAGSLEIYDILNLDASGNARFVPAEEYTLTANEVAFVDPSSLYIAEYNWERFQRSKAITTTAKYHIVQRWTGSPLLVKDDPGVTLTVVPHEIILSEGAALRVHPMDIRPSGTAEVEFRHVRSEEFTWSDPSASGITVRVEDPNFVQTNPEAVRLYSGNSLVIPDPYDREVEGSRIHISGSNLIADPLFDGDVRWKLEGDNVQYLTDRFYLAADMNQVAAIGSGSIFYQALPRPMRENAWVLYADVSASGYYHNDPGGTDDPASLRVQLRCYDREGAFLGGPVITQGIIARSPSVIPPSGMNSTNYYKEGSGSPNEDYDDTRLRNDAPTTTHNTETASALGVDAQGDIRRILLKIPDMFGNAENQIPSGSFIHSAEMIITTSPNGTFSAPSGFINRMLVPWTETATWNTTDGSTSWGVAGCNSPDIDFLGESEEDITHDLSSSPVSFLLSSGVQAWSDGSANHGWVLHTSGTYDVDNPHSFLVNINTSDNATVADRPVLSVTFTPSGVPAYEIIRKEFRLPLTTKSATVEVGASGGTALYRDIRIEPRSIFDSHSLSEKKYPPPYRVDVGYHGTKTYQIDGVQSLASASGIAHPYVYDWVLRNRRNIVTGRLEPHIQPFTILPLADSTDAVLGEMLPSGTAEDFTVKTRHDVVGVAWDNSERFIDEQVINPRPVYMIDRHTQVLLVKDIAGYTQERYALFSPDLRKAGLNFTVKPSGGYDNHSFEVDERPFVSFDLHTDNPHDPDDSQVYREPRGLVTRDGDLYLICAATTDDSIYNNRAKEIEDYDGDFEDAVLYRLDPWDVDHLHLTPPSGQQFGMYETVVNPTDMTWDSKGDLLIAASNKIYKYTPHYDVGILDRQQQLGFFREYYVDDHDESGVIL